MAEPSPLSHSDMHEPVLVYDRIAQNKRQTWLMMILFVILLGGFATVVGLAIGMPIWGTASSSPLSSRTRSSVTTPAPPRRSR